jgi:hypothetical protein
MSDKIKILRLVITPCLHREWEHKQNIIEGMLKTGKYQFFSFGGAINTPIKPSTN